ncbi:hypothetical protein T05_10486, partial [Trichinella murrelli]
LRKYRATLSIQCVDPFCCAARRTTLSSSPCRIKWNGDSVWESTVPFYLLIVGIVSALPHEEPLSALHRGRIKWNGYSD